MRAFLSSITQRQWIVGSSITGVILAIIIGIFVMSSGKAPQSDDAAKQAAAQKLIDDKTAADAAKAKADADEAAKAKTTPAPVPTTVTTATYGLPTGQIFKFLQVSRAYKEQGKPGINVNLRGVPHEVELTEELLYEEFKVFMVKELTAKINEPKDVGRKVTRLHSVLLTIAPDGTCIEAAVAVFDGTEADGKSMVPAGKFSAAPIVFSKFTMTPTASQDMARLFVTDLRRKLGDPKLAELSVTEYPVSGSTVIVTGRTTILDK